MGCHDILFGLGGLALEDLCEIEVDDGSEMDRCCRDTIVDVTGVDGEGLVPDGVLLGQGPEQGPVGGVE